MKNILLLFILLIPAFLFAQYPATGNKQRLGYQTTGDGLIWRGVAADTAIKPRTINNAYFQLDTVNRVLRRYIATQGSWQVVGGSSTNVDSLIYATRYWVNSNFFPLEGGTLTGTGGAGFVGFPSQVSAPGTPASGLNVYAQGSSFNWKGTDGFERQFASTLTGGRTYTLPDVSGTFALGTGTADRSARWSATNTLAAGNFTDNGTKVQALLPFQLHQWTTAGRPTGVTGYKGYNTTTGFEEGYFTSQWENYITSTGASNGQVSVFSSAGKTYGTNNLFWDNSNIRLGIGTASPVSGITMFGVSNEIKLAGNVNNTNNQSIVFSHGLAANSFKASGIFGVPLGSFALGTIVFAISPTNGVDANPATSGHSVLTLSNASVTTNKSFAATSNTTSDVSIRIGPGSSNNTGDKSLFFSTNLAQLGYAGLIANSEGSNGRIRYLGLANNFASNSTSADVRLGLHNNGFTFIGAYAQPSYQLHVFGTDAIGLPRGTIAQRPTIASSTSPMRFNTDSTAFEYGESVGTWRLLSTREYARGISFYGANGSLTSNRTVTGGSFWLNFDTNTGIKQNSPTQELDVNGDAYIRDSTRLTTTPAHSAITGLLTRDANGWVGAASLSGGLSYSGGVLSASGVNTVYTASDSIRGDRYLEMANDGSATTALGYFPSFPSFNSGNDKGLYLSPVGWGEQGLINEEPSTNVRSNIYVTDLGSRFETRSISGNNLSIIDSKKGKLEFDVRGASNTDKRWKIIIDSTKIEVTRNISGIDRVYNLLPASEYPSTTSSFKTILQWTGDGSNANPAFVEVKRDTTIYVTDADYNFGTAISSANVLLRYNRVFIYSKLTASATSDNQIILPSASTDFLQCSIYVFSNDASADADATSVDFTTNGAVDGAGGTLSSYALTGGQQILIRPTNDGGYKWFFN